MRRPSMTSGGSARCSIISGNEANGITFRGSASTGNFVFENRIGADLGLNPWALPA